MSNKRFAAEPVSGWGKLVLALGFFLIFCAPASAGKHPVPLEPNTDAAVCAGCHEDKTKGKAVHSAIATGCMSCHEVRVNRDITRVKLTTTTPTTLCLQCHADKSAETAAGKVHAPAQKGCVNCHDPHVSDHPNQLKKATSGEKAENLCLSCHTQGFNVPAEGSRHAALDMGCETCHTTHKTGEAAQSEFKFHLTKASPALCLDCHDGSDAALQKAHSNQPFATADCVSCHNPHDSNRGKLAQTFAHMPFEGKMCDSCHKEAKDGKVQLTMADSRALCLTCHEDKGKHIETAKVPHAGAAGDCTTCHNPHAGRSPGLLRPDPVAACTSCHSDQAEMHKSKKVLHEPAFEQGCATCHEPHGGDRPKLLRAENNGLCLECHGPEAKGTPVEGRKLVSIFGGNVSLPENYFNQVVRLPLKYGMGHPVDRHPVSDRMQPDDHTKVRVAMSCMSCHQPHGSAKSGLLVKDQTNNLAFCASCHKDLGR